MAGFQIAAATILRWAPNLHFSERVRPNPETDKFGYRAPARIEAPAIMLGVPQRLMVAAPFFVTVAERGGLVADSLYLNAEYGWCDMLPAVPSVLRLAGRTTLVCGNRPWANHYHWLFQCLAPALVAGEAGMEDDFAVLVPPLDAVRRDSLALCGIGAQRIVELPPDGLAMIERGVHSHLVTGEFAFAPHPALIAALERMGRSVPPSAFAGRKVYVARTDSSNRRMINEAALCVALESRGYAIVLTSGMSLAEQMALFRDARTIVTPHGAGLTNIVFASSGEAGPTVVELHQENYLHLAFLKICQAKGLRYHSVVSPMIDAGSDGRHHSTWAADLPLVLKVVDGLG
ncbi:glycosyltransferase family 61 protein [Sphingomonas quercus]|uniref:Glycosyltransferase family 61 protein n=1 Tax=Sphingomonas quercus TaxID=2842451 RepID=A0ABS6BNW0_9SPHN|nr:glycosyltransferase family 61 protein [Sphingomonas quercus]MBU3079086.1 glycosyltransferase family 61 protein [Sphingomonas quercus]